MSASFYDLLKYAQTGIASPDMTYYDKMRASMLMGGTVQTLTGIPPLSFPSDGSPLISLSMKGNGSQSGTPTPDNPVMPTFCGVMTENLFDYKTAYASYINADGDVAATTLAAIRNSLADFVGQTVTIRVYCKAVTATRVYVLAKISGATKSSNDIYRGNTGYMTLTVTPETSDDYWVISYGSLGIENNVYSKIMLNLGSTAIPYEPYGWAEKITCAGQTTPVYLGQTQTVRRVWKLVLTGDENYTLGSVIGQIRTPITGAANSLGLCTHYILKATYGGAFPYIRITSNILWFELSPDEYQTKEEALADFKSYLAAQYAAGTPVTVWYVLETPETGIVNEPLCKIGDYADELHSEDAGVSIPTIKGSNTLTVDTELQPSEMTITYKG